MVHRPWLSWVLFVSVLAVGLYFFNLAILQIYPAEETSAVFSSVAPCSAGVKFNTQTGALCAGGSAHVAYTFTRILKPGSVGPDVMVLQQLLQSLGFFTNRTTTQYYGPATMLAVGKFQLAYKADVLTPIKLTRATGIAGMLTINKLNALEAASSGSFTVLTTKPTPSCMVPSITSSLTASADTATPFQYTITSSGSFPMTYSADALPGGLTLLASTILGTSTSVGTSNISVTATNKCGHDTKTLVLTTAAAPATASVPTPNVSAQLSVTYPFTTSKPIFDNTEYTNKPTTPLLRDSGQPFMNDVMTDSYWITYNMNLSWPQASTGVIQETGTRHLAELCREQGIKYLIVDLEGAQGSLANVTQVLQWLRSENVPGLQISFFEVDGGDGYNSEYPERFVGGMGANHPLKQEWIDFINQLDFIAPVYTHIGI